MTIEEVKDYINSSTEYDFLRDYPHKIAFLTLGGSYAYGTNTEDSDIDLRGVFLSDKREILLNDSTKLVDTKKDTDTVMYTLKKYVDLCAKGNPTMLELLYFAPDRYLYVSDIGMELIKNRDMFLSKRVYHAVIGCVKSFMGNTLYSYYPSMVLSEETLKERKNKACKAMMYAVRMLINGINIMKYKEIIPLQEEVLNDLQEIRSGIYGEDSICYEGVRENLMMFQPDKELRSKIAMLHNDLILAFTTATLPDEPDWDRINNFLMTTNERIVRGMV